MFFFLQAVIASRNSRGMTRKLLFVPVVAALALLVAPFAIAGSISNQSDGGTIRDNVVMAGGKRGDGKAQNSTQSVNTAVSAASVTNLVVKATSGTLYWVWWANGAGATNYLQVYDSATLPADTAIPKATIDVLAVSLGHMQLLIPGIYCATGIVVGKSTTAATKTVGAADGVFVAGYL